MEIEPRLYSKWLLTLPQGGKAGGNWAGGGKENKSQGGGYRGNLTASQHGLLPLLKPANRSSINTAFSYFTQNQH